MTTIGYEMVSKPSVWNRLGFRYRYDEELNNWLDGETKGCVPSAITTHVGIRFHWLDRFRVLISGHCEITVYTKTNVIVDHAESRSRVAVLKP